MSRSWGCDACRCIFRNRERARKHFEILGVDPELLKDPNYIEYQLGLDIEGRKVSFGTRDEEYNGRHSVKVVWIGRKPDPNRSRSAARFFGGASGGEETRGLDITF